MPSVTRKQTTKAKAQHQMEMRRKKKQQNFSVAKEGDQQQQWYQYGEHQTEQNAIIYMIILHVFSHQMPDLNWKYKLA